MSASQLNPVPYQTPLLTPNGLVSTSWANWFRQLAALSGGGSGNNISFPITIAQGGTGKENPEAAITALTGSQTAGEYLRSDGTNAALSAIQAGDLPAIIAPGIISPYGGSSAPSGWLMCSGTAISRSTYAALFAAIGTTYGIGDGSTTFNLPNFYGVFPRGAGSQTIDGISYAATLGATTGDSIQGHLHGPGTFYVGPLPPDPAQDQQNQYNDYSSAPGFHAFTWDESPAEAAVNGNSGIPISDSTNGTPRTAAETRPANVAVNFIIKT